MTNEQKHITAHRRVKQSEMFDFAADQGLTEKEYIWKYYHITPDGRIIRRYDNHEIKPSKLVKGYMAVRIPVPLFSSHKDGRKAYRIHRLVAMFYLPDYSEELQINHKNGDKTDNRVENLEMCTNAENTYHAWNVLDSARSRQLVSVNNKKRDGRTVNIYASDGTLVKSYDKLIHAANDFLHTEYSENLQKRCKERKIYNWYLFLYADEPQPSKEEIKALFDTYAHSNHWLFEYGGKRYNLKQLAKHMHHERHCLIADIKNGIYPDVKILHYAN